MDHPSIPKLLCHYELTKESCSKPVCDAHLECISRSCCKYWKKLPAHLGLETIVADDIDQSQGDEGTKRHNFLCRWKEIKGTSVTYNQLLNALLKIDCAQDAEKVCAILKDSESALPVTSSGLFDTPSSTGTDFVRAASLRICMY